MTVAASLVASDAPVDVRERVLLAAIAANVARLRRNAGMDLDRLAEISGLPVEQLVAVEAGTTTPRLRALWALADAFEVPFGVLLSGAPCATTSFHVLRATEGAVVASERGGSYPFAVGGRRSARAGGVCGHAGARLDGRGGTTCHGHVRAHRGRAWRPRDPRRSDIGTARGRRRRILPRRRASRVPQPGNT